MPFTINEKAFEELGRQMGAELGTRMKRVADACNEQAGLEDGYRLGDEGDGPQLEKHDLRMTVITATAEAMVDNAKTNRLVANFHLAGGEA